MPSFSRTRRKRCQIVAFYATPELFSSTPVNPGLGELQNGPFQPHLGLHSLTDKLAGCHAVRLTYINRLTLTLFITEREIVLLDIVSYDEVCR